MRDARSPGARHGDVPGSFVPGRRRTARVAALGLAAALLLAPAARGAEGGRPAAIAPCPGAPLSVRGGDADDVADACAGGVAAIAFLARFGLDVTTPITVDVVARMPEGVDPDAAGCFDAASGRVLLLAHADFLRSGLWMGRPIDRAMHRAIAAHEVGHAVAACHFAMPRPARIATEYVAYVTMFETMDAGLRAHALATYPDAAPADDRMPGESDYADSPMRFGVRAWRHWVALPDPAAMLQAILEGRVPSGAGRGP